MRLQPRRQHEVLAERGRIFVDGEARTVGSDLEQHPAGLQKVDRLEPEPIDDFGWSPPSAIDPLADLELGLVVRHAPGNVMYSAGSPPSAVGRRPGAPSAASATPKKRPDPPPPIENPCHSCSTPMSTKPRTPVRKADDS